MRKKITRNNRIAAAAIFLSGAVISGLITGFPKNVLAQPSGVATVITTADITGDGAAHPLAVSGGARWVQIVCPASNSSVPVRVAESAVSATRGVPISPGAGFMMPPIPSAPTMKVQDQYYQLNSIYYLAQSGDKISVMWGR